MSSSKAHSTERDCHITRINARSENGNKKEKCAHTQKKTIRTRYEMQEDSIQQRQKVAESSMQRAIGLDAIYHVYTAREREHSQFVFRFQEDK